MRYVVEAEKFELRRSSRAKVSQAVATIDNDRFVLVERVFRAIEQMRERQMNRANDVSDSIFMLRQDIEHLPALGEQFEDLNMIDDPHR